MNITKLIRNQLTARKYYKKLVGSLTLCGHEKVLLSGTISPKILKHISKLNYNGELHVICSPEIISCNKEKLRKYFPAVKILDNTLSRLIENKEQYDVIISHFNYINVSISDDLLSYNKLLVGDGVLIIHELIKQEDFEDIKTEAGNQKFVILRTRKEEVKGSYSNYHLHLKHH